ncbi:tRNA (adenosine(37)-N6)-threonylcarbamoyltransferase complex dimerization subunit type 1 TsaB [Buchnera aphidicola]|uniref:tRNA (adenosine(37)-N6)-threonylcarbamoyltransferase complex dimerization subunit type 1 TsaB n=1 Tax=Buchnera aphidicola TaxID=9 RepID=UPI002093EB71|nr:tRNA (adenosine(37)-N6)-threonylcarbamoyltransferase complex dimerization subunit type 1 TsaB [Buchnera aphidicola]USS94344.1 tRNA (adenosine(37)-N6)-threonylcarbamoyltransferase complex dimerization subunit type 1 TsaB [Buchnera aphidicola (Sipha maydis)]
MKLLTIESSTNEICSVALRKNQEIDFLQKFSYNNHSQIILKIIHKILIRKSISLKDISYLAISKGPGSFTGLRISINIAQGFSTGLKIPLIGVSTLKILAEHARRKTLYNNFIVILQANKKNIYWGKYSFYKKKCFLHKKELYISNELAIKKIEKIQTKWKIIGKINSNMLKKINLKNFISDIYPTALDIIPFAMEIIKTHRKIKQQIFPNYLNNKVI